MNSRVIQVGLKMKKQTLYTFNCKLCNKFHTTIHSKGKFCSTSCSKEYQYLERIKKWKNGLHNGVRGKTATCVWIKRYMIRKYGEKCMLCNWAEINIFTGNIPIELEHIDGNFKNNNEENLKLLCPNCHSLTKTYKNGNMGNGRPRSKIKIV